MPSVVRHEEAERWFFNVARKHLSRRPRTGIHVSDLLSPRKAYWATVAPKEPTEREVVYFLAGRGHEDVFMAMSGLQEFRKTRGTWNDIQYEIDALIPPDPNTPEIPVELKTNRKAHIIESDHLVEDYEYPIQQLGCYAAIRGVNVAYLFVIYLMARNLAVEGMIDDDDSDQTDPYAWLRESKPVVICYQVEFTNDELAAIRERMQQGRDLFRTAISLQDHTLLPECSSWMCGKVHMKSSDPKCPQCGTVYIVGEEKPDGTKQGILKKCKTCKDPATKKYLDLLRATKEIFVPTCKWWAACKPLQWKQFHENFFHPTELDTDTPPVIE